MLINPDNAEIISWRPHGRAWNILDKERLGAVLLEQFGCDSVKKFLVSVNEWGFKVSVLSRRRCLRCAWLENWNETICHIDQRGHECSYYVAVLLLLSSRRLNISHIRSSPLFVAPLSPILINSAYTAPAPMPNHGITTCSSVHVPPSVNS